MINLVFTDDLLIFSLTVIRNVIPVTGEVIEIEVKQLGWGHTAIKWQSQNSNPGLPIHKPVLTTPCNIASQASIV